jgi:hypothetical protein
MEGKLQVRDQFSSFMNRARNDTKLSTIERKWKTSVEGHYVILLLLLLWLYSP